MTSSAVGELPVVPERLAAAGTLGRLRVEAVRLFAERGYHGVSVRDIVAAVGVNPSSLYAHYRSKEELFSQLVLTAHEEIRDRMRAALLTAPPDPAEQLRAIVRAHVLFHAHYPLLATIGDNDLHVLSGDPLQLVVAVRKEPVDLLRAVIDQGNSTGAFHCAAPWLAIAAIAGIGIRVAIWYRSSEQEETSTDSYAGRVRTWMPQYSPDEIADVFADYALGIVGGVHP
jgi:AcrR family transcriptional regulator